MAYALYFVLISFLAEALLYLKIEFLSKKWLLFGLIIMVFGSMIGLLFMQLGIWAYVAIFFSFYRLTNLIRIYLGRSHVYRLYNGGRSSSLIIIVILLAIIALNSVSNRLVIDANAWIIILALVQLISAICIFLIARNNISGLKSTVSNNRRTLNELPSITVAIPARNETVDLQKCLDSLLMSDYPKLEILVLDDSSQNKRTPEIIKGYAHSGVRFLAGKLPPDRWLPKNFAYDQLVEASSGELLLFCGVDVRFDRFTITEMVNLYLDKNVDMLGLMPENTPSDQNNIMNYIYQPSRYAWELALPRNITQRPPSLSTCWMISKTALTKAGGFDATAHSVAPERFLARYCVNHLRGYSFECSNGTMKLISQKTLQEQYSTALRTRYPSLHRKPELVALTSLAELIILAGPAFFVVYGIISSSWLLIIFAAVSFILQSITYNNIVTLTYRKFVPMGIFILPCAAVWDIFMLNLSMYRYEFGSVFWKGRNVTVPVMRINNKTT